MTCGPTASSGDPAAASSGDPAAASLGGPPRERSGGPASARLRRGWVIELVVGTLIYLLYDWLRDQTTGTSATAFRNAKQIVDAERFLGLYHEHGLQHAFLSADWFMAFWNIYYGTIHFVMPVVALVWLYRKAPARYVRWRNTIVIMLGVSIITFWLYPLMPPRLMPAHYGFVDTAARFFNFGPQVHVHFGPDGQPSAAAIREFGNLFAAMPSLHVGWSTWSVLAIWPLVRRRGARVLLALYPVSIIFCIVVTANHWILDAVGGWVVLGVGYLGAAALERSARNRLARNRRVPQWRSDESRTMFRAFTAQTDDDTFTRGVTELSRDDLPTDGALIAVEWSSVNYKDALAASAKGRVARISPLIVGIDLAGTVLESDAEWLEPGAPVIAHGYDLGVSRHGGFAELARVPSEWIVPLPSGLTLEEAMAIGTAGYTAALSVLALEAHGVTPDRGTVLVTGATGGVGTMAVSMLAGLGYEVAAGTGKPEAADYLRSIGAADVIDRAELTDASKPLLGAAWAGAVDCVGGVTLAHVLSRIAPGGAVAASGNTGGADLPTTVLPFILRGIALLGIDSVTTPIDSRRAVWERLGSDLKPGCLDEARHVVGLDGIEAVLDSILQGGVTGRYVVRTRQTS